MSKPKLTFNPDGHRYEFGRHDRVTIEGVSYRTVRHGRNEEGWLLELDDRSGRCESFSHQKLSRLGSMKRIRVEKDFYDPESAKRRLMTGGFLISELGARERARVSKKAGWAEAAWEMKREGLLKFTDVSIKANMAELLRRAMSFVTRFTGGSGIQKSMDFGECPAPRTLRRWLQAYRDLGMGGLVSAMDRRGSRCRLMGPEELAIFNREVAGYADEKRPTIKKIHENVVLAFRARNAERSARGAQPLRIPSYETVRRAVHMLDPFAVVLARKGPEAARKQFMPVGEGLRLTRPLERVEIDENTIDIISLMESAGLLGLLTEDERKNLGLDKAKARWFVTVAICATTRCILGMAFSRSAKDEASLQVLQMILRDKGKWADATGSLGSWDMHGTPALVVTDNGPAFKSERFRVACADLGITAVRTPAAFPQMRGRIERFFHSLTTGLLPRSPGRTFGSIREKGDANPEARAALTFDDLAFCLVRWIVDIYHNTPHAGLGGETPLHCWRRLTTEWGVQPPPDMAMHREVFGERLTCKLSREGVRVLGMRYHSGPLARLMTSKNERKVEVRWHPDDMGEVTVYAGDQKLQVSAVMSGFDGTTAAEWVAARRGLLAVDPQRKADDRETIMDAIQAIRDRSTEATTLAGLLVDGWPPERVKQEEDRLFVGFGHQDETNSLTQPIAADRIGRSIAGPETTTDEPPVPAGTRPAPAGPDTVRAVTPPASTPSVPGTAPDAGSWKITE